MDKITHEIRLSRWKKVIEQCNAWLEGMTAKKLVKGTGNYGEKVLLLAAKDMP